MNPRNILWNLIGLGLPLLIAAFTVPKLIDQIGTERFGFLALAWGLIGYAGILDLGIGRALTQKVASVRGTSDEINVPDIVMTAAWITGVVGALGLLLIVIVAESGVAKYVVHQQVSDFELKISILLLAFALPLQAMSATYKGANEAYLNFKGISILRIALGAANFGGPFLISLYSNKLYLLIGTLVLSRCAAFFIYKKLCTKCIAHIEIRGKRKFDKQHARDLFKFGGWVTVSSIISPFLVQADRFFIGFLMTASAVTLYVIPYEVTVQSLILVGAITAVAFPAMSNLILNNPKEAEKNFRLWFGRVFVLMAFAMCVLAFLMPLILGVWVGKHISPESIIIGRILCIGVFFNSLGTMFYAYLHAQKKVKQIAFLHIIELPIFIILLTTLIPMFGIVGAAIAWCIRATFDSIALGWLKYGRH